MSVVDSQQHALRPSCAKRRPTVNGDHPSCAIRSLPQPKVTHQLSTHESNQHTHTHTTRARATHRHTHTFHCYKQSLYPTHRDNRHEKNRCLISTHQPTLKRLRHTRRSRSMMPTRSTIPSPRVPSSSPCLFPHVCVACFALPRVVWWDSRMVR